MLMAELNRVSSHLMWMATNGMDLGSTSMMIYGFREREMVLAFFEKTTGLRMNHNYIRPGGVAADLPDGWEDDVDGHLRHDPGPHLTSTTSCSPASPSSGSGPRASATSRPRRRWPSSVTGPILRSTGVPWDLRRTMPYLAYDEVDFDVIVGTYGDNFDRYSDPPQRDPRVDPDHPPDRREDAAGDYRVQDTKVTPPPRARIDESMEALIHHFKIFTEGFRVPEGEVYVAIESPRGELGCYLVSDGTSKPYRMHIRGPSFVNLQALPAACCAAASWPTPSPSSPRSTRSWARWTGDGHLDRAEHCRRRGPERAGRPLPRAALGADPAVPPGPGAGRLADAPRPWSDIAELWSA